MFFRFKRWVLGKRLESDLLGEQTYSVFWGMPILSSDAISSVAYAVEEMLWVLVPVLGLVSYLWMPRVAAAVVILLLLLIFSYRQVVDAYPGGGGAYVVAKENLKPIYGLIAGASLSIDYSLTVAVSVSAGVAAITSAIPPLYPYRVMIALLLIALVAIGNVRGVRESSRMFSIPTYAFILGIIVLLATGMFKLAFGDISAAPAAASAIMPTEMHAVTLFLLLKAFSSGCSALTGVEAISDSVPNFEAPSAHNAKIAYMLLAASVAITFGGVAFLAMHLQILPNHQFTVLSQIAAVVFGHGPLFYYIQVVTALILVMAANTAFAGFPTLLSVIARDRYVPRQFAMRGHRLNFNNGIMILAIIAAVLVIIFSGETHKLIPLYAVGVFTSFTLAQTGLLVRWLRQKPEGWHFKAALSGTGALVTLVATLVIGVTKFTHGAWVVVVLIPLIVMVMGAIKKHYRSVAEQLDIPNEFLDKIELTPSYSHHVIVPIDSFNAMVVKTLRYATSMSSNVEAFHVETYEGEADKLRNKWAQLNTEIPLVIRQSPFREVVSPLIEYIDSEEHGSQPGDIITVLLPQFFVSKWWQYILHNNTSLFIARSLFDKRNVVVSVLPFYLGDYRKRRRKWLRNGATTETPVATLSEPAPLAAPDEGPPQD